MVYEQLHINRYVKRDGVSWSDDFDCRKRLGLLSKRGENATGLAEETLHWTVRNVLIGFLFNISLKVTKCF